MASNSTTSFTLPAAILSIAWRSYLRKLQQDPLLTKSVTSALLSLFSDFFAKKLTGSPLRSSTAINELTTGLLLRGPIIHAFHNVLDKRIFKGMNQTSLPCVLGKLAIDQLLFAPAFTALYFYFRALSEDRSLSATSQELRKNLLGIMQSNWILWIPANFVNYFLVPLEFRVLFGNVVSIFWNAYLISKVSTAS